MSEKIDYSKMSIYRKLLEVRKKCGNIRKKKGEQYDFVSSSQVLNEVTKYLDEVGLLLLPPKVINTNLTVSTTKSGTERILTEINSVYTWVNVDSPDQKVNIQWYSQGVDLAGEKGVGKAYTYGEKYFLLKQFNISTDETDPDVIQTDSEGKIKEKEIERTPEGRIKLKKLSAILMEEAKNDEDKAKELLIDLTKFNNFKGYDSFKKISNKMLEKTLSKAMKKFEEATKRVESNLPNGSKT